MKRMLITAVTTAALGLSLSPVHAQDWSGRDPAHDERGGWNGQGDISRVDVSHRKNGLVVDTVFRVAPYDALTIFINTHKARRGAEYHVVRPDPLWGSLHLVDRAHDRVVRCPALKLRRINRTWRTYIPRSCIRMPNGNRPRRVRIKVLSVGYGSTYTHDWAPGKHRSSPWIKSG